MNPSPHWDKGGIESLRNERREKQAESIGALLEPLITSMEHKVRDYPDNAPEPLKIPLEQKIGLMKSYLHAIITQQNPKYEYTDEIKTALHDIIMYLAGEGRLNPKKGMLLTGNPGCGKTFIMQSLSKLLKHAPYYNEKAFLYKPATEICDEFSTIKFEKQFEFFNNYGRRLTGWANDLPHNHLCIDDLGKEEHPRKLYPYGDKGRNPIISIINDRYMRIKHGIITHATSNFSIEGMDFYGPTIQDRFYEMFNVIKFTNDSFR